MLHHQPREPKRKIPKTQPHQEFSLSRPAGMWFQEAFFTRKESEKLLLEHIRRGCRDAGEVLMGEPHFSYLFLYHFLLLLLLTAVDGSYDPPVTKEVKENERKRRKGVLRLVRHNGFPQTFPLQDLWSPPTKYFLMVVTNRSYERGNVEEKHRTWPSYIFPWPPAPSVQGFVSAVRLQRTKPLTLGRKDMTRHVGNLLRRGLSS